MDKWATDFICGSISGICGLLLGHPLDTIKCRMQYQSNEYKTLYSTFKRIIREEKFISLFKGVIPPLCNQFPINAL